MHGLSKRQKKLQMKADYFIVVWLTSATVGDELAPGLKLLGESRDGHNRISNLPNTIPGNFGPESSSFIELLSPKLLFTIIPNWMISVANCWT